MGFSSFFSKQARKPAGLFGRFFMSAVFDFGNANLNNLVFEKMSVGKDDQVLEIGSGTGKLINRIANQFDWGTAIGIDFSETMVTMAEKRNKLHIKNGKVRFIKADFDEFPLESEQFDMVCSVNTIYFWEKPGVTAEKIHSVLKPRGKLVIGLEDSEELKKRKLSDDVFHLHSKSEIESLLLKAGFQNGIEITSSAHGSTVLNCVVAIK